LLNEIKDISFKDKKINEMKVTLNAILWAKEASDLLAKDKIH